MRSSPFRYLKICNEQDSMTLSLGEGKDLWGEELELMNLWRKETDDKGTAKSKSKRRPQ